MANNILYSLLHGVGNAASSAVNGIMPDSAEGLISAEDLANARRQGLLHLGLSLLGDTSGNGLGPALAAGVDKAQGVFGNEIQSSIAEDAMRKQKNMLAQRQAIAAKYAPTATDTEDTMFKKFPAMYADFMRAGDLEAAHNVEGIVQRMIDKRSQGNKQAVQAGDRIYTFDPLTGSYTPGPERHENADVIRDKALQRALTAEQIAATREQRMMSQAQTGATAFMRQNQDLLKTEQAYQQWKGALASARAGNPAAYKSAIVNFAGIADSKAQIRLGMLNYLGQIDPSVRGRADLALAKLESGQYPVRVLEDMDKHVTELHRNTVKLFDTRRAGRVKALPQLESYIPTTEEAFPSVTEMGAAPTTPTAAPTPPTAANSRVSDFLKH